MPTLEETTWAERRAEMEEVLALPGCTDGYGQPPVVAVRFLRAALARVDELERENEELRRADAYAIVHQPKRCAGDPTVGHTRVGVHDIINRLYLYGWDVDRMLEAEQPACWGREHVEAALWYYGGHREEIEAIRAEQRRSFEEGLASQEAARGGR